MFALPPSQIYIGDLEDYDSGYILVAEIYHPRINTNHAGPDGHLRFWGMYADENGGSLLTDSFKLTGTRLFVNVAAHTGELHVEVLDAQGQVIATSAPCRGDQTRAEILWQKGNLATLKGQTLSLRFRLRNASLYSYWMN